MTTDKQRVVVVTGASSGLGKATAKGLAARGWHVIGHGRDARRSADAAEDIRAAATDGGRVDFIRGDLALLSDVARMANDISALTGEVHVLINNAGGPRTERIVTPEGNEATFAGNHLGHFLLTQRLLPLMRQAAVSSAPGTVRIANVSSSGHEASPPIDWDDLQYSRDWVSGRAYCLAKLYNILFTNALAERLAPDGIVAHAMHPGVVGSNFVNHCEPGMQAYIATLDQRPPEEAADTLIWMATAAEPGASTGRYYHKCEAVDTSAEAQDAAAAERLWRESEALVARAGQS